MPVRRNHTFPKGTKPVPISMLMQRDGKLSATEQERLDAYKAQQKAAAAARPGHYKGDHK